MGSVISYSILDKWTKKYDSSVSYKKINPHECRCPTVDWNWKALSPYYVCVECMCENLHAIEIQKHMYEYEKQIFITDKIESSLHIDRNIAIIVETYLEQK
jgi:hypothetical protein